MEELILSKEYDLHRTIDKKFSIKLFHYIRYVNQNDINEWNYLPDFSLECIKKFWKNYNKLNSAYESNNYISNGNRTIKEYIDFNIGF